MSHQTGASGVQTNTDSNLVPLFGLRPLWWGGASGCQEEEARRVYQA